MFQDEARFGRISDPRKCLAPAPPRPVVKLALVRQYVYAYAAASPRDGVIDWMLGSKMHTLGMGDFLRLVSERHPEEFVVMVIEWVPRCIAQNIYRFQKIWHWSGCRNIHQN